MSKSLLIALTILLFTLSASAKRKDQPKDQPPDPAWAGITARGRLLAEYDWACWQATEAVLWRHPATGSVTGYIAQKTDLGWTVVFGRFNAEHDKYLIVYQVTVGASPQDLRVAENAPYRENTGFYFLAATAIETSKRDFQGLNRPYNVSALPADSHQMYVYLYPAPLRKGVHPLGGDVRYLVSADGSTIIEKRQLHKTILDRDPSQLPPGAKAAGGFHTHVLSDVPEDTDVFYVLVRKPPGPEFIGAGKRVFKIDVDGTISLAK